MRVGQRAAPLPPLRQNKSLPAGFCCHCTQAAIAEAARVALWLPICTGEPSLKLLRFKSEVRRLGRGGERL